MRPVHTTFDRSALPTNLLTVTEWRWFARHLGWRTNWENTARRYAAENGGAIVMLMDDTLVVFTKLIGTGKVRRSTHKPGTWSWAKEGVAS